MKMTKQNNKTIPKKEIDTSKLPCANCEWRYSIHCPKCEWNKKGNVKVY